ncbi:MAG TPA: hypothetical protein VLE69_03520 [Candidatus Saccharimonadales bacterium]|nr:hypothetical protein [Candidatus Saccharimonadales bacterium]
MVFDPSKWAGIQWLAIAVGSFFLIWWILLTAYYWLRKLLGKPWYKRHFELFDDGDYARYNVPKHFKISHWRRWTLLVSIVVFVPVYIGVANAAHSREEANCFANRAFVQSLQPVSTASDDCSSGEVTTRKFGCKATFVVKNNEIIGSGIAQVKVRVGQDGKLTCTHEELDAPQQTSSD